MDLGQRFRRIVATGLLAVLLATGTAWAGPPTDVVREKQTQLFHLLEEDPRDDAKIGAVFDEMLDYRALAAASLGPEWDKLSDAQRDEITGLLKQLITRAYEKHLEKTLPYRIDYVGEEPVGDGLWMVRTLAVHKTDKRAEVLKIAFELAAIDKTHFKVVDIVFEEVSLVDSYRAQFTKILKKEGWDGLVKRMKEKIAKGE